MEGCRRLTDGRNFLWVYAGSDGALGCMTRFGENAPGRILGAIAEVFDVQIVSEYEPQYWGFEIQEEWKNSLNKIAKETDDHQYTEIMKYLHGEENDLRHGTTVMDRAEIAKDLVSERPDLLSHEQNGALLQVIEEIYETDHTRVVILDETQIAAAIMSITDEDDLPQA